MKYCAYVKKINYAVSLLCFLFVLLPLTSYASEELTTDIVLRQQDVDLFLSSLNGVQGAGALGVTVLIVQTLILVFKSQFLKLKKQYKILSVTLLTMIVGVLSLKISGLDWASCFLHSTTLSAAQVFAHNFLKSFLKGNES